MVVNVDSWWCACPWNVTVQAPPWTDLADRQFRNINLDSDANGSHWHQTFVI